MNNGQKVRIQTNDKRETTKTSPLLGITKSIDYLLEALEN